MVCSSGTVVNYPGGGGGTSCNGLYRNAPSESGSLFRLEVYKGYRFHGLRYRKG